MENNILVAQSGGPSCAINASLAGVIKNAKKHNLNIYGAFNGIEGILNENFIKLSDISEEDLNLLIHTPAMALGSCRYKLKENDTKILDKISNIFIKYNIKYFFYIGGNDSMDTVKKISSYFKQINNNIKVIGIPKTIDNDLMNTDHTPGFGSACRYIITTINELIRDLDIYSIPSITIIEIMGRNAGWLTLAAGMPLFLGQNKPDFIYLPEVPFSNKLFIDSINERFKETNNIIIVVSEGLKNYDGEYIGQDSKSGQKDNFGHIYLSGVSKYLEHLVRSTIGCKVRSIELNLMQRCSAHIASKTDLDEAEKIGFEALNVALENHTGVTMIYERISSNPYKSNISFTDVSNVANLEKKVPDKWLDIYNKNIQKEIVDYILPLTKGIPDTFLDDNGFNKYFIIKKSCD